jgi:NAD(P)H-dependent FMN reductase
MGRDSRFGPEARPVDQKRRSDMMRVAIIIGSTRPERKADRVAGWVHDIASKRVDATFAVVDLADYDLPHLDEVEPAAMRRPYRKPHTHAWSAVIASFDAFVFVTPEYNHSTSGVLKNAIDFLFWEWNDKAAAFVSYGVDGGTRAVEHLRLVAGELKMADVRTQVALSLHTDFSDQGDVRSSARHEQLVTRMLDEVIAWGAALRRLRTVAEQPDSDRRASAVL